MLVTQHDYDQELAWFLNQAGFMDPVTERTMGLPDHLFAIIDKDEFDESEVPDVSDKYKKSCPYYTVTTPLGTFGIAWIGPESPVLDLKDTILKRSLHELGTPVGEHVYHIHEGTLSTLRQLLV